LSGGLRVLIVEDSDDTVHLLELLFANQSRTQVEIERAASLAEALDLLDTSDFDAALVDLGLPDTEGLQSVEAVRRKCPELPIVVLTGAGEELALDALRAGAQDYLSKPELSGPTVIRSLMFAMERGRNQARITELAYRDQLTGAATRAATADSVASELASMSDGKWVAVVFLDVNRFKFINDTFGHGEGDRVLAEIGRRLRDATRRDEVVGRWGGDEFVVLTSGRGAASDAARVVGRLSAVLADPPILDPAGSAVTSTVGYAVATDAATTADELVARADAAMYELKHGPGAAGISGRSSRSEAR
jgi:two-component system, cell cycle response regulator